MPSVKVELWHIIAAALGAALVCSWASGSLRRRAHPLADTFSAIRSFLVPSVALFAFLHYVLAIPSSARTIRIAETICGISAIWVALSLIRVVLHERNGELTWRSRVPGLFVDLVRFTFVGVGALLVIAFVWEGNLTSAFATLGVGSLVLGLALQDTLGNLMAGIALLFERPFQVGDWIKVGDTVGEVLEMNWRAVRVQTRSLDSVVIPNSVLGKERIHNYSRPTRAHGVEFEVSFSYQDPPNKVKRVLTECARRTADILPSGISIRLKRYEDSSMRYITRVFIERFDRLNEIESEFMTHVWYAARRAGITIPYPIRTVFRTEVPAEPVLDPLTERREIISRVPIFTALSPEELAILAENSSVVDFAAGEPIIVQGETGESMYIIRTGRATVRVKANDSAAARDVAEVGPGDFFGEFAVLTGEQRHASVVALDDVEVVAVTKHALEEILSKRPELAGEFVSIIEARKHGLRAVSELASLPQAEQREVERESGVLLGRIRKFFRI